MNRNTFDFICQLASNEIQKQDKQFRQAVPVAKRVATSLWCLGSGECYRSVGLNSALGKASAKIIGNDFVNVLVNHHDQFIYFPETEQVTRVAIDKFRQLGDFPQVVGAVDGTYIQITTPKENRNEYYCRKGYPSVILQGTVDADLKFIDVCTGFLGSLHDARAFRLSNLHARTANGEILTGPVRNIGGVNVGPLLLADCAYSLKPWLMKPYPRVGVLTPSQNNFNRQLSKLRSTVERAFGLLKDGVAFEENSMKILLWFLAQFWHVAFYITYA